MKGSGYLSKSTEPLTKVAMPEQIIHRLAENQVMLSFLYDDDALAFREWWQAKGSTAFALWVSECSTEVERSKTHGR